MCSMYVSAGVCGRAVVCMCMQCVYVCVPVEACVYIFVWCVFTLSCAVSMWVYGRWLLWCVVCVFVSKVSLYVSLLKACVFKGLCV